MSNTSTVVNGENTGGVEEFPTDASVDIAIHDHNRHISCGKTLPVDIDQFNSQDSKAGILNYSCEFDHMYASLNAGTSLQKDNVEVNHLKDLILLHLDLIQHQSEQLVTKDKQIAGLRQENETLRQRLERMDRRVTLHKHREVLTDVFAPAATGVDNIMPLALPPQYPPSPPGPSILLTMPVDEIKQEVIADMLLLEDTENVDTFTVKQEMLTPDSDAAAATEAAAGAATTTCYGGGAAKRKRRHDDDADRESDAANGGDPAANAVAGGRKRKRAVSWTGSSVHSDAVSDGRRTPREATKATQPLENKRTATKKGKGAPAAVSSPMKADAVRSKDILTTPDTYYTFVGDVDSYWGEDEPELNGHMESEAAVQVPRWRLKSYSSCYTMEGTENLDDEVFNKRHSRHEIDERRRKRWDSQRIREQRQVEKLKQRESSRRSSVATRTREEMDSPKVHSFWPHADDVEYLEVTDTVPVAAFGLPISEFPTSEFSLPWLTYMKNRRKQATIQTTPKGTRRRNRPAVKSRR